MSKVVGLSHLGLLVEDIDASVVELVDGFGFEVVTAVNGAARRAVLVQGEAVLVLEQPVLGSADARLLRQHGGFVVEIGLGCTNPESVYAEIVGRGAHPAGDGLSVVAFGNVRHALVPVRDGRAQLPGIGEIEQRPGALGLQNIDHLAVCVPAGALASTIEHYCAIMGFRVIFRERIAVGDQVMLSTVVQDLSGTVTLTVIEPDGASADGQISTFLRNHNGVGVQHVAFRSDDAVVTVDGMRSRGVEFLSTGDNYYVQLAERIRPEHHRLEELRRTNLLLDEDERGQLFQIFTRSTHPRSTLFYEVIERAGATTFGSNNINALYEAVRAEQEDVAGASGPR